MARRPDPDAAPKLLAAARAAFAHVGVEAARVEDIAHAAGLSKGAFYLPFTSKEAAFHQIVTDFFAVMHDVQLQRHEACNDLRASIGTASPDDWAWRTPRLQRWAEVDHTHTVRALNAMWRNRDVLRIILEHAPQLLDRFVDMARDMCSAQLREAADHGGLRADLDRDLVSELIVGIYIQLGRRMLRLDRRPDFESWATTVDTLMLEGLAPRAQADSSVSREAL